MNVARLGDAAGKEDAFCTEFKRLCHVFPVLDTGSAEHANGWVHSFHGRHGIADDGRVGRSHRDVAANKFGWLNGNVGWAQGRQRLGFIHVSSACTDGESVR